MVSINFRDIGIGALQQIESNRRAQDKRISDRGKEERERKNRLAELDVQGGHAMDRQKMTSSTAIKTANIAADSRELVAKATAKALREKAILADNEKYSDWGFSNLFEIKLPKGFQYNNEFMKKHSKTGTGRIEEKVRMFNNAVKYAYQNTGAGLTDEFKTHVQKELNNMIIGEGLFNKKIEALSGNEIGGNFDFKTGAAFLYNWFEGTPFQSTLDGPSLDPHSKDPDTEAYLAANPKTALSKQISDQPNLFKKSAWTRLSQIGNPDDLVNEKSVGAFRGNNAAKLVWINTVKNSDSKVKYDTKDPTTHLDALAVISAVSYGAGSGAVTRFAGQRTKRTNRTKEYSTRIKSNTDKHTEAKNVLNDITALRGIGETLDEYGMPKLNIVKDVITTLTGIARSLIKGTNKFTPDVVGTDLTSITINEDQRGSLTNDGDIVEGLNANAYFNSIKDASNKRLGGLLKSEEYASLKEEEKTARYAAAVQWEARTIQLVYKIAKMVQGGSGGQAVSNADFQAVLKSFQSGALGTREGTLHVFSMMQKMVEREYLYTKIMSDETIVTGARDIADSALRTYRLYHKKALRAYGEPAEAEDAVSPKTDQYPPEGTSEFNALPNRQKAEIRRQRNALTL